LAKRPLLLLTNDDGIASPGLLAAVRAVWDLGEVLVVAPKEQQTGAGRSLPPLSDGKIWPEELFLDDSPVNAFSLHGSPAQAVQYALMELAPRRPSLVISGINYGENLGTGVTVSGTIGAALEAAVFGIPALAVSLETGREYHYLPSPEVDFSTAAFFTRFFAQRMLERALPPDVDVLKVDIPQEATPQTPWRLTRVSRQRYHCPTPRSSPEKPLGYETRVIFDTLEPDSDIYALVVDRVVSVSPLSIDLTSRTDFGKLRKLLL